MSNLPNSRFIALDANGDPVSGAKLYTYIGGTTTNKATYDTRGNAVTNDGSTGALANPVVADGNGVFSEIYLAPNAAYKLVLTSSDDATTYWTDDDVYAVQLSNAADTTLALVASTPLDHGAVGDGAADESTEVQAAITAAVGTVDLLGKTFRCDSAISVTSGLTIKNGTLDFGQLPCTDNEYVTGTGTIGSANALTGNATRGALTLSVTDAGVSADDWLLLSSTGIWAAEEMGEMVQVHSVSGLTLTLKQPIEGTYNTADTAGVQIITPVEKIRFENVKIIGSTAAASDMISLSRCVDVTITDCRFENVGNAGVEMDTSASVRVQNCVFEEGATNKYAVKITSGCRDVHVENNTTHRIQYGVTIDEGTLNYQSRYIWVANNIFSGILSGCIARENAEYVYVLDNHIIGNTAGAINAIHLECPNVLVRGNTIRESGNSGIHVAPGSVTFLTGQPWSCIIANNSIRDCDNIGINVDTAGSAIVRDNTISDSGQAGITMDDCQGGLVTGNVIHAPGTDGIVLESSFAASSGCGVIGNFVDTPGSDGIVLTAGGAVILSHAQVSGNRVVGVSGSNVALALKTTGTGNVDYTGVTGNILHRSDDSDDSIQLAGNAAGSVDSVLITGNHCVNGAYGVGEPTDANNTSITVFGNVFASMASGIVEQAAGSYLLEAAADDHNGTA